MMDLQTIQTINADAGRRARRYNSRPWNPETLEHITKGNLKRIPLLGDYVPKGYETVDRWFVDKTGMDTRGPAMSVDALIRAMREDFARNSLHSYGFTDEGQFQIYVTIYQPKEDHTRV